MREPQKTNRNPLLIIAAIVALVVIVLAMKAASDREARAAMTHVRIQQDIDHAIGR